MRLVRRILCLALALCALLALSVGARAVRTVVSFQKMRIDGFDAPTTAYNIDGNNYFKLRDIAYLLNATDAHFCVEYDARLNAIMITTGPDAFYDKPDGTELSPLSAPKKVVQSPQTLYIDGVKVTGVSAYNIDGSNFFKLRDLGEKLGFGVDYDASSNTILITTVSEPEPEPPAEWDPDISFRTVDMDGNYWDDSCFASAKLTMINYWAYWCGPCVGEMPDLQKIADTYADCGLQVIGIYDGADEAMNKAKAADLGITYPNIRYHEAFDPWLNTGYIPDTIFVDGSGKVVGEVYIGSRSYAGWAELVESFLG